MNYNRFTINGFVLSFCIVFSSPNDSAAQAYVDQAIGAQKGGAYVPQASPDSPRPRVTRRVSKGRAAAASREAKPMSANDPAFPTVGAGASAIIKIIADDSAWPSVGKGAVRNE